MTAAPPAPNPNTVQTPPQSNVPKRDDAADARRFRWLLQAERIGLSELVFGSGWDEQAEQICEAIDGAASEARDSTPGSQQDASVSAGVVSPLTPIPEWKDGIVSWPDAGSGCDNGSPDEHSLDYIADEYANAATGERND